MEQRPPRVPKLAWVEEEEKEEEEGPGALPAQETEEVQEFQPLEEDSAMDQTQEQDLAGGLFRRTAQLVCNFIRRIREEGTSAMAAGVRPYSYIFNTKATAALLDMLVEEGFYSQKQVPAMVRYIHQWLMANQFSEHRLNRTLLDLSEAQPTDVVIALLRVAPTCDRAAMTMWKTIMCSSRTVEPVVQILLDVLRTWPEHSTCTSDGDNTGVFALAATVVMWKFLQVPCVPRVVKAYFPRVLVHLLFQVFFSTLEMPQEVDTFWKACQEQHGLAISPNRFAVRALKSLLCRMHREQVVLSMERKCGWDTLLCADTHHHAVGLLAREISCVSRRLSFRIVRYLLRLLSTQEARWDLPALAFLVEVLARLDLTERGANRILEILSMHLQSECKERRHLALRALLQLTDKPSVTEKMWSLTERLVELLQDADGERVRMTVMVLSFIVLETKKLIPGPIALQLAEALLPLFDYDNSQVQLVSILLFRTLVTVRVEKEKEALKSHVHQSLLPLFFHCHDENQQVAEASQRALLSMVKVLKRRDLANPVKDKQLWKFAEVLLAQDESRAAEHLHQALPYLHNPQEPLRAAAIRFMGMAGQHLRGNKRELQSICQALDDKAQDISPAIRRLALETAFVLRAAPGSILQKWQDGFRRARKNRPCLWARGWLCCWSSEES
ncbi:maestro heat-like repeat-containing protein family member 6 [Cyanistes caeruleus]|uniref:maestro heat-like repeat-containing protein family member 6 n=1 Tax=Cyanistes caeruleus TaxID=156563 RepID=UPI000CDB7EF1|nr:maestro heat-like repeat-containing protein family member 6 [Cyanistes caeruleus]